MAISNYGELKAEAVALPVSSAVCRRLRQLHHACSKPTPIAAAGAADGSDRRCSPPSTATWPCRPTISPGARSMPATNRTELHATELEYVHPAYLPPRASALRRRCSPSRATASRCGRSDDAADAYELHYYQKIPTLIGSDTNTNWLLTEYPNAYLFGLMVEAAGHRPQRRNGATLQGAPRRGVRGNHPALCADHRRHQPERANRGVLLMPMIFDGDGNEIADIPLSEKQQRRARAGEEIVVIYHTPQMLRYLLGEHSGSVHAAQARRSHIVAADAGQPARLCRSAARDQSSAGAALMPARKLPVEFGEWRPDIALLDTKFAARWRTCSPASIPICRFRRCCRSTSTALPECLRAVFRAHARRRVENLRRHADQALCLEPLPAGPMSAAPSAAPITWQPGDLWMFEQCGQQACGGQHQRRSASDRHRYRRAICRPGRLAAARHQRQADRRLSVPVRRLADSTATINKRMIIWSAINDITGWTVGTQLCDMQEFPDGGPVQGMAGGEIGYVRAGPRHPHDAIPARRHHLHFQFLARAARSRLYLEIRLRLPSATCCISWPRTASIRSTGQQVTPIGAGQGQRVVPGEFRCRPGAMSCIALPA